MADDNNEWQPDVDPTWRDFQARHRGNPFLDQDPLHAMPLKLINILEGTAEGYLAFAEVARGRGFLSEAQARFERDLASTAGGGFFHRRPFGCLLLPTPAPADDLAERVQASDAVLQEMLDQDAGVTRRLASHSAARTGRESEASRLAAAYAGWLVGHREFLSERHELWRTAAEHVTRNGFPSRLRRSVVTGELQTVTEGARPFQPFYQRWGLESFGTWDLPIPSVPELYGPEPPKWYAPHVDGLHVFIPWYVFWNKRFDLHQLNKEVQWLREPEHLRGWLDPGSEKKGVTGLGHEFTLYRYLWLVIERRYPNELRGNVGSIDRAFGAYMGRLGEESVKRYREGMPRPGPASRAPATGG